MLLSVARTHTHTHTYIQQADLFLMELLIFTQAECGKIDSDFHSHSTALIYTSICCSTMGDVSLTSVVLI